MVFNHKILCFPFDFPAPAISSNHNPRNLFAINFLANVDPECVFGFRFLKDDTGRYVPVCDEAEHQTAQGGLS